MAPPSPPSPPLRPAPGTPVLGPVASAEQASFRVLLDAMSRPGSVGRLHALAAADGGWASALALMQALVDHEVTFAVAADSDVPREQLLRRTGARVAAPDAADFVLADAPRATAAFRAAKDGEIETPERAATVVVRCTAVGPAGPAGPAGIAERGVALTISGPGPAGVAGIAERGVALTLSGPGIDGSTALRVAGIPPEAFAVLIERNADFPGGLDVVLADPEGRVACLPRSTRIERVDAPAGAEGI